MNTTKAAVTVSNPVSLLFSVYKKLIDGSNQTRSGQKNERKPMKKKKEICKKMENQKLFI